MPDLLFLIGHSTDDPDRAATALHTALAATRSGSRVALWLSGEGVRLGVRGVAETLREPLPESAGEMMAALEKAAVSLHLERTSFERREYEEAAIRPGGALVRAEHLAALIAAGWHAVSL